MHPHQQDSPMHCIVIAHSHAPSAFDQESNVEGEPPVKGSATLCNSVNVGWQIIPSHLYSPLRMMMIADNVQTTRKPADSASCFFPFTPPRSGCFCRRAAGQTEHCERTRLTSLYDQSYPNRELHLARRQHVRHQGDSEG